MAIYAHICKTFLSRTMTPTANEFDYETREILSDEAEWGLITFIQYGLEQHDTTKDEIRDGVVDVLLPLTGCKNYDVADMLMEKAIDGLEPNLRALLKER